MFKVKKSNFEKRTESLSKSGQSVIYPDEWEGKSGTYMKCMQCHRDPCICEDEDTVTRYRKMRKAAGIVDEQPFWKI